jgi:YidC/Oxa1 family membrane protein insertase
MFEIPAALLAWLYNLTDSYLLAIALMSVVVMAVTTPLTLKSTKGMLEMQKISPEMRRLQNEHRNDKQKLNEEMMKLYQDHKVNPMSSCLPIFAQMPVFIVMFRVLRGLTYVPVKEAKPIAGAVFDVVGRTDEINGFIPRFLAHDSALYQSLYGKFTMPEIGLDLSLSPFNAIQDNPLTGVIYALLVVALGGLYFGQQRMVAARAAVNPTMSPTQQKVMQYLPVAFAVFQIFFMTALVFYYIFQTLLRILQQYYITRKFYGHDEALGRQAQRAGEQAREAAKDNGEPTGLFGQAKRDILGAKGDTEASRSNKPTRGGGSTTSNAKKAAERPVIDSKRVTAAKSRPATAASTSQGSKGRPTPTRKQAQAAQGRPSKSSGSARSSRPGARPDAPKKSANKKKR